MLGQDAALYIIEIYQYYQSNEIDRTYSSLIIIPKIPVRVYLIRGPLWALGLFYGQFDRPH